MTEREPERAVPANARGEREEPVVSVPLDVADHAGRPRRGRAVLLRADQIDLACSPAEDEDFRIVIVSEPVEEMPAPGEGVVVSAPASRLRSAAAVGEVTATYSAAAERQLALSARDLDLLRRGRLFAATPLQLTPAEVFAGGQARLALLARELLACQALAEYLKPIAIALRAPDAAKATVPERLEELREHVAAAADLDPGEVAPEVKEALARLSELVFASDTQQLLAAADRIYPNKRPLMEDIYLLRALRRNVEETLELLALQRFLRRAAVPAEENDLALDRSLVTEQLTFATLAVEPQRLAPARSAMERFRRQYIARYREHHTKYWAEMARLHARLIDEQPHADALRRLNSLAELGPPVGVGALAAFEELLERTVGCPLIAGVEEIAGTEGLCPACGVPLDEQPPAQRIDEVMARAEKGCERQLARLSSGAIVQVLRRSNEARVAQFLKMVQASHLTSLCDVMDDELVGYLRRFLVECRIEAALQPIFDQLQGGVSPNVEEAQHAMREVSRVLQRAFQATRRALPPGEGESKPPPARRKRKR